MNGRHVERRSSGVVLDIGVSPCLNEQLHAQGSMVREGCVVEGRLTLVVLSIDVHLAAEEGVHDDILPIATGNMEGGTAVVVDHVGL